MRYLSPRDGGSRVTVVEEMAIASGTHVPPVYLQKGQRGINALDCPMPPLLPGQSLVSETPAGSP